MGQTHKRKYDRYTLEFKLQAVKLANIPSVMAKDVAQSLGIHTVMLYRWQMEYRKGELKANKHMKAKTPSPKRRVRRVGPDATNEDELSAAKKRIKQLERALASRTEELDLLKKAKRFFEARKK